MLKIFSCSKHFILQHKLPYFQYYMFYSNYKLLVRCKLKTVHTMRKNDLRQKFTVELCSSFTLWLSDGATRNSDPKTARVPAGHYALIHAFHLENSCWTKP